MTVRHDPVGRGHAYRESLDQRVPTTPLVDEPFSVRALVADDVTDARLEVVIDDGTPVAHDAHPLATGDGDVGGADGHLAAAASAGEQVEGMHPVAVDLPGLAEGTRATYRWLAGDAVLGPFVVSPATWRPAEVARLRIDGPTDRIDPTSVAVLEVPVEGGIEVRRVRFDVRLDDAEHVLGLGERFHALDHRGRTIDTVVFEQYKAQGERTYLPVPFALVVGGPASWALQVDTTRRCWWDIGASTHDRMVVEVTVDPADPTVELVMSEGTPAQLLDAHTARTGRPAPVPSWVFRPWASGNEWNTQARVEAEMSRSLAEGIDVGVIVIEAWADEATFTAFRDATYTPSGDGAPMRLEDFTFPADGAWPDPVGMVRWLHDNDIRVLLWQIPLLPVGVPADRLGAEQLAHDRRVLADKGYAVAEADGSPYANRGWWFPGALMPDFTSPDATRWWTEKRRYLLEQVGIDGFKTDGGEHAWGDDLRYADGTRGLQTNNVYPNLYARAYTDLMASTGTAGITFSRAGFTGAGTTPCHWAGDEDSTWEAFRASILAGLSAGVSGVSAWGFDHGGFSGEVPDPELYLRSGAMAMLSPVMQYHSEFNHHRTPCRDRTPWNIAERHDAPEVLRTYRRFTDIRRRLGPYLDEQYHEGARTGMPLMRTLALGWPTDQAVWAFPFQYLLGEHLLVAPVTAPGVTTQPVHLPEGRWVDVWDGTVHAGPAVVEVVTPIDRIPAFVTDTPEGRALARAFGPA